MKQILFNTEMVRVIMEGRKTVTRRVVKPQPKGAHTVLDCDDYEQTFDMLCGNGGEGGVFLDWAETIKAPCWAGDILWVRETWAKTRSGMDTSIRPRCLEQVRSGNHPSICHGRPPGSSCWSPVFGWSGCRTAGICRRKTRAASLVASLPECGTAPSSPQTCTSMAGRPTRGCG